MNDKAERVGRFTSSNAVKLLSVSTDRKSFGKPALTYIKQKNRERLLGRSVKTEVRAKQMSWGKLGERFVFQLLGMEYSLNSTDTILHPEYPDIWAGSPDGFKYVSRRAVVEIKAPSTHDSFCDLVEPIYNGLDGLDAMSWIRKKHDKGEEYYQQIVSNCCISGCDYGELIVFMPYKSQLSALREFTQDSSIPMEMMSQFYWIYTSTDEDLPYLIDGAHYKNINKIFFKVPEEDKDKMTDCMVRAGKMLAPFPPSVITSTYDHSVNATIVEK